MWRRRFSQWSQSPFRSIQTFSSSEQIKNKRFKCQRTHSVRTSVSIRPDCGTVLFIYLSSVCRCCLVLNKVTSQHNRHNKLKGLKEMNAANVKAERGESCFGGGGRRVHDVNKTRTRKATERRRRRTGNVFSVPYKIRVRASSSFVFFSSLFFFFFRKVQKTCLQNTWGELKFHLFRRVQTEPNRAPSWRRLARDKRLNSCMRLTARTRNGRASCSLVWDGRGRSGRRRRKKKKRQLNNANVRRWFCSSVMAVVVKPARRLGAVPDCETVGDSGDVTTAACWPPLRRRFPFRSARRWSPSPARTGGRSTSHRRCDPRRTSGGKEGGGQRHRCVTTSCTGKIKEVW